MTRQEKKARARARAAQLAASPRVTALGEAAGRRGHTKSPVEAIFDAVTQKDRPAPPDDTPPPPRLVRPGTITGLAVLDLFVGASALAVAAGVYTGAAPATFLDGAWAMRILGYGAFGAACILAGLGLLLLRPFGRTLQIGLSLASLLGGFSIPVAVLIFIYMVRPGVGLLLSGRPPARMTAAERVRVRDQQGGEILISLAAAIQVLTMLLRAALVP